MKALLFGSASIIALALGARAMLRRRTPVVPKTHLSERETRAVTRRFLLYFIVPLWFGAALADWTCHRSSHIETTTGAQETLIHLLVLIEMGTPVLAGLFFEIKAPMLAVMIAAFFVHEWTGLWDVSYAVTRREVTPVEQHIHSFLEMLLLMAAAFISVLHWPALRALVGLARDPDPSVRLKNEPLPKAYIAADLFAIAIFEMLPYPEELWRDWRANPGRLIPPKGQPHQVALKPVG